MQVRIRSLLVTLWRSAGCSESSRQTREVHLFRIAPITGHFRVDELPAKELIRRQANSVSSSTVTTKFISFICLTRIGGPTREKLYSDSLPGFRSVIDGIDSSGCGFNATNEIANGAIANTTSKKLRPPAS